MNTQVSSHTTVITAHRLHICRCQVIPLSLYVTWSVNIQSVMTPVYWYVIGCQH